MTESHSLYSLLLLDIGRKEIRLLEIKPSESRNAEIVGSLTRRSLCDTKEWGHFEALSYVWGQSHNDQKIRLSPDSSLGITDNLAAALRVLRYLDKTRKIWIDAVCINQSDCCERSEQIQLMRFIYGKAKPVIVWLDADIDGSLLAAATLESLNKESWHNAVDETNFWKPLSPLLENSYWSRVWIQQEISSATEIVFQCRDWQIPPHGLFHCMRLWGLLFDSETFGNSTWLDWLENGKPIQLPKRFDQLSLQNSTETEEENQSFAVLTNTLGENLPLLALLNRAHALRCSDDRDKLYALLGLANDVQQGDICVDYTLSLAATYTLVPHFVIKKHRSLSFLHYAGLNYKDEASAVGLPSWVPDWTGRRKNIDPYQLRHAENGCPSCLKDLLGRISEDDRILHAYGVHLTSIIDAAIMPRFPKPHRTVYAWEIVHWCLYLIESSMNAKERGDSKSPTTEILHSEEWLELIDALTVLDVFYPDNDIAARMMNRLYAASARSLFIRMCNMYKDGDTSFQSLTLAKLVQADLESGTDQGQKFAQDMYLTTHRHKPFVGTKGEIGLVPEITQPGDELWFIFGCNRVSALRPGEWFYHFLGQGYLKGYNRGELYTSLVGDEG